MDLDNERFWMVRASLIVVGTLFAFFVIAPGVFGYPLDYDQAIRLLQIILPVFVGYLGLATAYLFQGNPAKTPEVVANIHLLRLLLRGPIYVLTIGLLVVVSVFWYSNRRDGTPASGMTVDQLSWFVSALLALLAATTGLIVSKIFPGGRNDANE